MKDFDTVSALETAALEARAIAELFSLISDYEKEGHNAIRNYSNALWYASECARKNAGTVEALVNRLCSAK